MRSILSILLIAAAVCSPVWADGLPPGEHTRTPKYWPDVAKHVVNYTPLQFNGSIHALTPRGNQLWFALGETLEHIEGSGRMTSYPMPAREWQVGGIAVAPDESIWFSAGQSGRIGFVDRRGHYHFEQLVPRKFFPDIRDLAVTHDGRLWFADLGRRSFGYRDATGTVREVPVPENGFPRQLIECGGTIWITAAGRRNFALGTLDSHARVVAVALPIPRPGSLDRIACDGSRGIWFIYRAYQGYGQPPQSFVGRVSLSGVSRIVRRVPVTIALTADGHGGAWVVSAAEFNGLPLRLTLWHIRANGTARSARLPMDAAFEAAQSSDGSLWLGDEAGNSPIAITRLF